MPIDERLLTAFHEASYSVIAYHLAVAEPHLAQDDVDRDWVAFLAAYRARRSML
ncbi:MAG: hypothetical protein RL698_2373 [Pseudomonadota bacterium]|jgi:hypothetical protein